MASTKKYFHDHFVLLLLSINGFLALSAILFMLLRLSSSHGSTVIIQYRQSLGVNAFKTGTVTDLLSFVAFAALIFAVHALLSIRAYEIHRQLAIAVLSLGILLLSLTIIISNALLMLR